MHVCGEWLPNSQSVLDLDGRLFDLGKRRWQAWRVGHRYGQDYAKPHVAWASLYP